jgi:hypothetical protein
LRDRDVMNLLDQIELYVLGIGRERIAQKDYWLFIYNSMKSGLLMTKAMERHLQYKLKELGIQNSKR